MMPSACTADRHSVTPHRPDSITCSRVIHKPEHKSRPSKQPKAAHPESSRVMCYHDQLSREEAEDMLAGLPPGAYLVRPSSEGPDKISLSLVNGENTPICHYLIRTENGYKLDGRPDRFCCLQSFLKAHSQHHQLGMRHKLQIPIFSKSLFHKVDIWEYQNGKNWEQFGLQQTFKLATLRKKDSPHRFEDKTSVNLVTRTREVPCMYGVQSQNIRTRTVYALCRQCTLRTVHPNIKYATMKNIFLSTCNSDSDVPARNSYTSSKYHYCVWEYHDELTREWKCFEYTKSAFQHILASYSLLCLAPQSDCTRQQFGGTITITDANKTQWYINLRNSKVINCSTMKSYDIRQRQIYGLSSAEVHEGGKQVPDERRRYLQAGDKTTNIELLTNTYCSRGSTTAQGLPQPWTEDRGCDLTPASEEYRALHHQLPELQKHYLHSVVRLQEIEVWRLLSKELQLLRYCSNTVAEALFWAESSLSVLSPAASRSTVSEVLHSMVTSQGYHLYKSATNIGLCSALVLSKVIYDSTSSECVVDNLGNVQAINLEQEVKGRICPLFVVYFRETDVNNTNTLTHKHHLENKSITLNKF